MGRHYVVGILLLSFSSEYVFSERRAAENSIYAHLEYTQL